MDSFSEIRRALHGKASQVALRRLQDQVSKLATALSNVADGLATVAAKDQRFSVVLADFAGGAATVDVTVTWPVPWPDAGYMVLAPLPITGPLAIGKVFPALKAGSKTTTQCVVTVVATQAVATVGLEVYGVRT